jgi:hypothetical protein
MWTVQEGAGRPLRKGLNVAKSNTSGFLGLQTIADSLCFRQFARPLFRNPEEA